MIDLRAGGGFATAALGVALLALYPSVAPFTPAVLLSVLAGAVGAYATTAGAWRRGVVTIQLAVIAIVGSPMMPFHRVLESRGWLFWEWYLGATAISAATAAVLYLGYIGRVSRRASG